MNETGTICKVIGILLVVTCCLGANVALGEEQPPAPTLDEVISNITAAEQKLKNIRLESKTFLEERTSPDAPWKRTCVCYESTAWYTGQINGPARIDVHREVLRWEQGAAPFAEESYSVGFDGQRGRTVNHRTGPAGKTFPVKEAMITAEAPRQLHGSWARKATGMAFALNFLFHDEGGMSASHGLRKARELGIQVDITRERFQDANCVKLTMAKGMYAMWFDLDHGYAFCGNTSAHYQDGEWVPYETCLVTRLIQAAPGLWFPGQVSQTKIYGTGPERPDSRTMYQCTAAVANDPGFDPSVFKVPIPPGHVVRDEISGVRYRQGPATE